MLNVIELIFTYFFLPVTYNKEVKNNEGCEGRLGIDKCWSHSNGGWLIWDGKFETVGRGALNEEMWYRI